MWPGSDSQTWRHMSVDFVVGSHPCLRVFTPGTPVFLSLQKPTFPNFNSIWNAHIHINEFLRNYHLPFTIYHLPCVRASHNAFALSSDWFVELFASTVIGQSDYFGFGFVTLS